MDRYKLKGGYSLAVSDDAACLSRGLLKKYVLTFRASPCDETGRGGAGGRLCITAEGEAPVPVLTEALICVSRAWRDGKTNEIFLLTDSGNAALNEAAKKAEYVECRREIRGAGDLDTVLYKRHTDR
ncbi:MAG: hypothetical protein J5940_08000 [Clostridia bacterium]|nr:hypothetical protein [Clostridia bacterium]